jgi:hypothetical protein
MERLPVTRRRASRAIGSAFALAFATRGPLRGQSENWKYQERRGYHEGTRTELSTGPGPATLDLIAALIDYAEPYQTLPSKFKAWFYLPASERPSLSVRELTPRYFYQLGDVDSIASKGPGTVTFEWPTDIVVRHLNYSGKPLSLADLGAVVRLGYKTPRKVETISPVALFHSRLPSAPRSYRFVLLPGDESRLEFQVYDKEKRPATQKEIFDRTLWKRPETFYWSPGPAPSGWYQLRVTGWRLRDNASLASIVDFYHWQQDGR